MLDRLAPNGEVAHEEDIGEFAVLRNAREGRGRVAHAYLRLRHGRRRFPAGAPGGALDVSDERGRARARGSWRGGQPVAKASGAALARNLTWVVERAASFAEDPRALNLVGIKPGRMTGNWRDSEQGLGQGSLRV